KKKKSEEKDKVRALPKFELAERQSATDLRLSPDGTHVLIVVTERTDNAKRPNVPNYVTESSYTEDIPARTFVGDAQDKRTLAILNLETGKAVTPELPGEMVGAPVVTPESKNAAPQGKASDAKNDAAAQAKGADWTEGAAAERKGGTRDTRWAMPQLSEDGAIAVAHVRSSNNKDRWLVTVDPDSGKARMLDALHDAAWVREL